MYNLLLQLNVLKSNQAVSQFKPQHLIYLFLYVRVQLGNGKGKIECGLLSCLGLQSRFLLSNLNLSALLNRELSDKGV